MHTRMGTRLGAWTACIAAAVGFQGCSAEMPGSTGGPSRSIQQSTSTAIHDVALRANNGQYVVAEGGGGREVNANRNEVGSWERFSIVDRNGGDLVSGDAVNIVTRTGHYLVAEEGGGGGVQATRTRHGPWETFIIFNHTGSTIENGHTVSLRASNGQWLVAEGGGGREVNANRDVTGPWERFTFYTDTRRNVPPKNP